MKGLFDFVTFDVASCRALLRLGIVPLTIVLHQHKDEEYPQATPPFQSVFILRVRIQVQL